MVLVILGGLLGRRLHWVVVAVLVYATLLEGPGVTQLRHCLPFAENVSTGKMTLTVLNLQRSISLS